MVNKDEGKVDEISKKIIIHLRIFLIIRKEQLDVREIKKQKD